MKIDFVIPWVDGADPKWQAEFKQHHPSQKLLCDTNAERYRDWDLLKFWFRGVEKNAPWVNKIYFITWGHIPQWLNINHPKLVIVHHQDYIPKKYLPTFNSNTIEINMHRIKELSEHFVYFNDDLFLVDTVLPQDFFMNGLPNDSAIATQLTAIDPIMSHIIVNNIVLINKNFNKYNAMKKKLTNWFNLKYGANNLRNLCLLPWNTFSNLLVSHSAQPFLKSTLKRVWEIEHDRLDNASKNRFRSISDVNQYLFKFWHLCENQFTPFRDKTFSTYITIKDQNLQLIETTIKKRASKILIINDSDQLNFETCQKSITKSFELLYPEPSAFETQQDAHFRSNCATQEPSVLKITEKLT